MLCICNSIEYNSLYIELKLPSLPDGPLGTLHLEENTANERHNVICSVFFPSFPLDIPYTVYAAH